MYINLLKIILPKIVKFIFTKEEQKKIPEEFILKIEEIFKLWRDKWEIFDNKFFQGLFIYLFNYDSNNKIEKFYSDFIKEELDKYSINIENLNLIEPQKIKILGNEYGLDTDSNTTEIITGLKKIKKMELLINLSKDIDGKEYTNIQPNQNQETSKIQKILQNVANNYNNNHNIKEEYDDDKTISNNDNDYNDIDGEPL